VLDLGCGSSPGPSVFLVFMQNGLSPTYKQKSIEIHLQVVRVLSFGWSNRARIRSIANPIRRAVVYDLLRKGLAFEGISPILLAVSYSPATPLQTLVWPWVEWWADRLDCRTFSVWTQFTV
jgi:hypothetical protein